MKLCNFASLDPGLQARGIRGLANASRADRQVWQEFQSDWAGMVAASEAELARLMGEGWTGDDLAVPTARKSRSRVQMPQRPFVGQTEVASPAKARRGQDFFRRAVLASYDCRCCVTGNPVPELLTASHILPWRTHPKERLNPQNGLCLAKTHDAAFDIGLIAFDADGRLLVSRYIGEFLPNEAIERDFVAFRGKRMTQPEKFPPKSEFLHYHRTEVFLDR
jgi:hypothetical protein